MELFLKYIYAVEVMYAWTIGPIKISICCLYIRIFGVSRWFKYYNFAMVGLTILWGLATLFGSIFQCIPVAEAWNPLSDRSMCVDLKYFLIGTNTVNFVLDFMILTAPIRLIWKLQLTTRKKLLVLGALILGAG